MRLPRSTLWTHHDFMKFWSGQTVSLLGWQLTAFALPLIAAITFQANSLQIGILKAAQFLPYLLIALPVGVWVDRSSKRPLLIMSNVGHAVLLGLVLICVWLGVHQMECLILIAFLVGVLTLLFDLAYQAYLPALLGP